MAAHCTVWPLMAEHWDPEWWGAEIINDPAYREEVLPLLLRVLSPIEGYRYLDMGCGEGQGMRAVGEAGGAVVGCDLSPELLGQALASAPVVRARLPSLGWLATGRLDGAYAVLVLEHIADVESLFDQAARVVRAGGVLAVVANHPAFTAPGAGPLIDPTDGEVSWRWGPYLQEGMSVEPGGRVNIRVYHRPLGQILTSAARAGWSLAGLEEAGVGAAAAGRDPVLGRQANIPRLVGIWWENRRPS